MPLSVQKKATEISQHQVRKDEGRLMVQDRKKIVDGLLKNGLDSIRHAMDHFSERNRENGKSRHDDKWIVLSIHHAAECVCNALLLLVEPNCSLFKLDEATIWFPSLSKSIDGLKTEVNHQQLTSAEKHLLLLLSQLPDIRHEFMHRVAPEKVDVSIAAMCLIGILKHIEARYGTKASDIVWQSPPIETDVVAAIRYQRLEEYGKFVESFLQEKYPNHQLQQCPSCSTMSVIHTQSKIGSDTIFKAQGRIIAVILSSPLSSHLRLPGQ